MNKIISSLIAAAALFATPAAEAQQIGMSAEGASYYLPKTVLKFKLLIEKTTYTPGDFAGYASRYLRRDDISVIPKTEYRIAGIRLQSAAMPDTAKFYTAKADAKHSITKLERDDNGVLTAINTKPRAITRQPDFKSAAKPVRLNPRDYMTKEILNAGSSAKMAELCVQEIYDIRENKGLLNKGQADFMPKDGEQLRIMIDNLNTQENALMQLFVGTVDKDTVETTVEFVPTREVERQLLFRFSKHFGLTDSDDLGGSPYYIKVEDLHTTPSLEYGNTPADQKKDKDNVGVYVNLPGKIRVTVSDQQSVKGAFELYAGQFGKTESISGEMFSKKQTTSIVLNPITGSIEKIETESLK